MVTPPGPDEGKWLRTKRGRVRHHVKRHFIGPGDSHRRMTTCGAEVHIDKRLLDFEPDYVALAASEAYPKCEHCLAKVAANELRFGPVPEVPNLRGRGG